ncbi:MAG: DUF362 domain-containing protein, partial [Atribacterota bacterium]|nr:DUF362 domain-containing protein [Atribacterota bacterium]
VFFTRCQTYQKEEVRKATNKLFQDLGGLKKYIKPGNKVLLKVNLLMKKTPQEAVTTHPVLVEAIIEQIQALGAKVLLADSPGGPFTKNWLKGIYRETGMEEIANNTGAELNWNFQQQDIPFGNGKILKQITLANFVKEADVIISIAKLKTHGFTIYTGAVKNLFGTIPGLLKAEYHLRMSDIKDFSNMLIDVVECVKPQISIMDAVIGMEGDGPSAGDPRPIGLLAASANPHALDFACAHLIGLAPNRIDTLNNAIERNLIPADFKDINIQGIDREELQPIPFKVPASSRSRHIPLHLPPGIDNFFYNMLRPRPFFIHEKCVGCGLCAQNCPAKCIEMINKKPHVNLNNCIRCFCCQELCPYKAVEIKRGKLSKVLFR